MGSSVDKLLGIGSEAIDSGVVAEGFFKSSGLLLQLKKLLDKKNGFYAFESALRVFPFASCEEEIGIVDWNSPELWKCCYAPEMVEGGVFFAEDVFGGQFCIKDEAIYMFDPETGLHEFLASDIEGWASLVLKDYNFLTGYELGRAWQQKNKRIPRGKRLLPIRPFVLGGEYVIQNLAAVGQVESMRFRGELAVRIRFLPDGTDLDLEVTK